MKRVNDSQILVRRQLQKEIGLIQLPDEYMIGHSAQDSKYRFCEVIDAPAPIPVGSKLVVHELQSQSLELIGDKVHRVPIEFALGYLEEGRPFQCLKNLVLVKPDPKEETVSGSFILAPEFSRLTPVKATVLQVGPDCKEVKVGDRVVTAPFAGLEIELEEYGACLLVREFPLTEQYTDELLGWLENDQ